MATETLITESHSASVLAAPRLDQLSFTRQRTDDSMNFWRPREVSGGWIERLREGHALGREAIDYIRASGDAAMLQGVVRTIADRGTFGAIEVGFFAALSLAIAESG